MSKMNFDGLKNIKTPENWIEKAAAIPETTIEEKPPVVPFWKSRALVTAASLVLVSALSLLLYLSFGMKPPVEVKSSAPATEIIWSTDANGETVATEVIIVDDGSTGQNGTQPTEAKSGIDRLIEQIFGTEDTSPTTATDRSRTNPSTKTNPTEGGKTAPTTAPDPVIPPVQPTEAPEEPPTEVPEEPPTETPEEPPTTTPWEPIWDEPTEPPGTYYISVSIPWSEHPGRDHNVFCRLETFDGEIIGEGGLFDSNRLMGFLGTDRQKNIYSYQFKYHITIPDELKGEYVNYYVYDIEGNILRSGTCLL